MQESTSVATGSLLSRRTVFLLVVALAVVWFVPLGWRHLVPSDEGRYAEMAREMFVTGDWITPRYNGYKYFEKPPLQTWANALTFAWFGIGDWQSRLYTALCGFGGVLLIGFTGARLFNSLTGLCAAVLLATAPYWNLMGHFNTLDMGLSFWMVFTMCSLMLAQRPGLSDRANIIWMLLCWASMGMAVLSKGLVGVILPGSVLILYSLITRDWLVWRRMCFGRGIVMFCVVTVPWFVLVQIKNPDFFHYFFIVQQFQRYLTPEQHRPGPFYYFVPVLLIGFLPWLGLTVRTIRQSWGVPRQTNGFAPVVFMSVWTIFIFLFFSASHSKLLSYTLPIAPAIALLIARVMPALTTKLWRRHLLVYGGLLFVLALATPFALERSANVRDSGLMHAFLPWVLSGIAVAFVGTVFALWLNRRHMVASIVAFGAAWLLLTTIVGTGHDVFGRESSGVLLVPAVNAEIMTLPPDTPFYSIDRLDHTLPYYLGHTMIMVHSADELTFGVHAEPQKWVPTIAAWETRWRSEKNALALMSPQDYERFHDTGLPMTLIAQDDRRVIVSRRGE